MAGAFPFHFPVILGWDAAGVVEEVGPAVTWFKPGDAAYGYCRRQDLQYGTYAEFVSVPEGYLAHMPRGADLRGGGRAAARRADRPPGAGAPRPARAARRCSSPAAPAASGHFAVQLALARGAQGDRHGLPGQPRLPARARRRADGLRRPRACPRSVRELTHGGGADAAFDLFGGDGREQAFASLRRGGRLVSIALPPPEPREHFEVRLHVRAARAATTSASTSRRSSTRARCGPTCPRRTRSTGPPRP